MTSATETAPVTRDAVAALLWQHPRLTWFGDGYSKVGVREDCHTNRERLASAESLEVIEAVRGWLAISVQLRRGRLGGPTDRQVTDAASRALGVAVVSGECLAACLMAGVPVDFFADAGTVTVAVTHASIAAEEGQP